MLRLQRRRIPYVAAVADQRDLEPLVGLEQRVRPGVAQLWDLEEGDESIRRHTCVGPKKLLHPRLADDRGEERPADGITRSSMNVSPCSRTVPRPSEDVWTRRWPCKACDHA